MAELLKQLLSLPRSEKWHIFTILAEELRNEEIRQLDEIPQWQLDLSEQALKDIEKGNITAISESEFWTAIDAMVEHLERHADS